jgi:valyl-tRNA synthetase
MDSIPEIFKSGYNPQDHEQNMLNLWHEKELYNPDICEKCGYTNPEAGTFSMVLPPPNVTGQLHLGHASMLTIEDIMTRYNRMLGRKSLWLPGTDHAAIATQTRVEKVLAKEKTTRSKLGREEFLRRANEFALTNQNTILHQSKMMGASLDWSRLAYTMDEDRSLAVRTAFKRMYDDGLIFRDERIVNWDPKGQTVISDDEIVRIEEKTKFYYFQYGPFVIGTARPETKFSDKYIVIHPDDERYLEYTHMQELEVEWINGPIKATIIKDSIADPEFGTGVMTITPWHSQVDFELAQKYNLDKEQIIDIYGKLLPVAGEFSGMKIAEAREKIVEKLDQKGLLVKIDDNHELAKATAERSGGTIEPQVMKQWWIDVEKEFQYPFDSLKGIKKGEIVNLKKLMQHAVRSGNINILPKRFEKVYFHWIDNLQPWCISRQIWFGHQIPVWYKHKDTENEEIYTGVTAPNGDEWEQDPDTLDTWFSSGLWTFSTLGWPNETSDFLEYHPTDILETAADIIFFWVARMILMSTYLIGHYPFKTVYFHGLVRDEKGRKISKSLGNNIDPLDVQAEFGTDALRMALIVGTTPGQDVKFSVDKVRAYKKFANKLWNITRFVLENINRPTTDKTDILPKHQKYIDEIRSVHSSVTEHMNKYRYYLAGEELYHFVWHSFADKILESCKIDISGNSEEKASAQTVLYILLRSSLIMLHPFMPFITETIWKHIPHDKKDDRPLIVTPWTS